MPPSDEPHLTQVYTASGQWEAYVIKGKLESQGIPVLLKYESAGIVFGITIDGLGEVRIWVPTEMAERARAILDSSQ
ncbi:MAG: DUF2007 domain-containing protein [Anaerolineae bacterium]